MSPSLSDFFLRSQSDERLASLAVAGHDRAFATIVERYRPELLAFARRLNSDGRAEDLLQQAFLSALVSLRSGTEVTHVRGWLYQIVRNAATKVRPPRDLPLDDVVVAAEPLEDVVQRRATALSAVAELSRLPERQREALLAVAVEGRAGAEVALRMGLSEGALRQLVHRARATLRGAVTAVTPWTLARWVAAIGPVPGPDVAAVAGVTSLGGVTAKVGALLATGVLATTVAVLPPVSPIAGSGTGKHLSRSGRGSDERVARDTRSKRIDTRSGRESKSVTHRGGRGESRSVSSDRSRHGRPTASHSGRSGRGSGGGDHGGGGGGGGGGGHGGGGDHGGDRSGGRGGDHGGRGEFTHDH